MDSVLKRFGFVRLSRYGLVLTPEGRIMSLRPALLDDGIGGRIVGWKDRDLAAAELAKWEPVRPATPRAVASRVAVPPPPMVSVPRPVPAPVAVVAPLVMTTAWVAPDVEVDEDEWEWTIALARARAVAEEVEASRAVAAAPRRTRQDTVPPPPSMAVQPRPKFVPAKTQPMAMVAAPKDPIDAGAWPKTEPLGNIDYNDYTNPLSEVVRVARQVQPPPSPQPVRRAIPRASSPTTVIPVPRLPRAEGRTLEPVVRAAPVGPRRFPKGTGPQVDRSLALAPPPPIRPAEEDRTLPGIVLPPPATLPSLPRIPGLESATRG